MFTRLHAYIVDLFSQPPTPRAIAAKPVKRPLQNYAEPQTIILTSALSVVNNYQTASANERRDIVLNAANLQPPKDASAEPIVLPLNRGYRELSQALLAGREYHPLCRHSFVECHTVGYYAYERRNVWKTCALAAAYAGIFGPGEIERPEFSYSQCCWLLSQVLGYDPSKLIVDGPTGRRLPVAEEMVKLVDDNLWNRRTVAAWLYSVGL